MSCILNIETATNVCSVAVSYNGNIVFERENLEGPSHASLLGVFANDAIQYIRNNNLSLDAVAVSCGPGSYTGLRIGVSEAKGICYGLSVPLIALKTPLIMAERVVSRLSVSEDTLLCPMIDARRMEVYAAIYNKKLEEVREIAADIVDEKTYETFLDNTHVLFFGNGADKCKDSITDKNAEFLDDIYPSARYMVKLAELAFDKKEFVDVAYFEPFYLKDFVTTVSKKSIF